ncbi:MAG: hypothetical protein H0T68_13190 [Gemmatimonadales bacterium]|nr:hypothetical protein [Gemmatimonadales bacterium]
MAAWTLAEPVPGGGRLGEIRLVQPTLVAEAGGFGRLSLLATINLEGLTIERGELTPGAWGEGFVDRRHPHTYVHELLLTLGDLLGRRDGAGALSLTVGKGFAPFGTDDPMMRPPLRYPVNHHLSQILERAVAIAALRAGPVRAEFGLFNGDEPERPGQWPRVSGRFGDSWSVRLTGEPLPGIELQGSHAQVHSPEHRPGAGTDQRKWSLSALWTRPGGGVPVEALVEWARTSEADGFFVFHSVLAEGAWSPGRHRLHYRFERTERPEEERVSPFRSLRPHLENSILGVTRWTIHTFGYEFAAGELAGIRLRPLAEVSLGSIAKPGGGLFQVEELYGRSDFWTLSLGLRLGAGAPMPRMGRYGAARGTGPATHHEH